MKKKLMFFTVLLLICLVGSFSTAAQSEDNLIGYWKAEAPDAPQGFNSSIMQITIDSVFTTFAGETFAYHSIEMNFKNDTLTFIIGGIDVLCTLRFEDNSNLKGNAVWSDGASPLFLTKMENQEPADPVEK